MRTNHMILVGALVGGAFASGALGQAGSGGTITAGTALFTQGASPTTAASASPAGAILRITGTTGVDSLFGTWWWYRVNGVHTRENAFFNADAGSWSWTGNTGQLAYTTTEFTATMRWVISQPGTNAARVETSLTITNRLATPLDIALFEYTDIDYGGSIGADNATLASPNTIHITDTTAPAPFNTLRAYFTAPAADAYQVTAFNVLGGLLTNTAIDNCNNSGLPFGPADWTGAFQFNRMIPAQGSATVSAAFGIEPPVTRCVADVDDGSGTGTPDGGVTIDDLLYYLIIYGNGAVAADVDDGSGTGTPDGGVTIDDLLYFLLRYANGC